MTLASSRTPPPRSRSTSGRPPRSRTRRIADVAVTVVLTVLALGLAYVVFLQFVLYPEPEGGLVESCKAVAASGTRCSQSFIDTIGHVGVALAIFGFLLPVGFAVVRIIQNRLAWFLPLISLVVLYGGFVILTIVLNTSYLPPR